MHVVPKYVLQDGELLDRWHGWIDGMDHFRVHGIRQSRATRAPRDGGPWRRPLAPKAKQESSLVPRPWHAGFRRASNGQRPLASSPLVVGRLLSTPREHPGVLCPPSLGRGRELESATRLKAEGPRTAERQATCLIREGGRRRGGPTPVVHQMRLSLPASRSGTRTPSCGPAGVGGNWMVKGARACAGLED